MCVCVANRRLSEMSTELMKTQEHAKRFQELLVTERRKQRGMRVSQLNTWQ